MEYITVQQAAEKLGVTVRQVQNLCNKGRIQDAIRFNRSWAIPKDVEKPRDGRYKETVENQNNIIQSFRSIRENKEMLERIVEFFPYPIHVYTPDGTLILVNEACLKIFRFVKEDVIGKFNILQDSIIDKWGEGVKECILRSFQGETIQFSNLKMPIQDIIKRFDKEDICFDSIFQNITCFPIYNDNHQLSYVVNLFITSKLYQGKEEIINGKAYIENNWQVEFDIDATAKASGFSKAHFIKIFKAHTGFTPHEYYQEIKIKMIKEKLLDLNLSISQVFAECGMDYNSHYTKIFKSRVGTTPSKYRRHNS
ncbi:MAG: AraC family transcriptional regulator [Firmicutes bacterium HGW-Firmicutes-7]|nr:MAG: AraC family transcriptional regulator [Firmicutes bacterium HGW-Firmicutes-7]